jgi:hypothetical protein
MSLIFRCSEFESVHWATRLEFQGCLTKQTLLHDTAASRRMAALDANPQAAHLIRKGKNDEGNDDDGH